MDVTVFDDIFGEGQTPQLLLDFYTYYDEQGEEFMDVEVVEEGPDYVSDLLGEEVVDDFVVIAKHGSDSLIAYWTAGEADGQVPIVWLDSEGTPNSVIAATVTDLFSLLLYDLGFVYDVVARLDNLGDEAEEFADYELEEYLEEMDEYEGYDDFKEWLEGFDVEPAAAPLNVVRQARQAFPDLEAWLEDH